LSRYLVTGAAGFIGARVCELLADAGHEVAGIDNLNEAYDVRLKQWRLDRLRTRPGFAFTPADVSDPRAVREVFAASEPFDAVVNLAARSGVRQSLGDPQPYFLTNVMGTLHLLEACREAGVGKFVLASSSSVYGASGRLPCAEDDDTDHPISPYAASKKAAETLCHAYHAQAHLDVTIFRYFTVYGPAGRPDMSPFRFVQWISEGRPLKVYGDGRQSRDFTYVDDIARGTVLGLKPLGYEIINLGSDRPIAMLDVIRLVERLVGREAHLTHLPNHPADVPATWADLSKARALLGWEPATTREEGFADLIRWYRDNRKWASEIETT
jgi:nucleoside-diphosphate-sugar epimerase